MVSVFTNSPGDQGLISGQAIPKTKKMVLGEILLNTQHYKVRFKGKRWNPGKRLRPLLHRGVEAIEKGA